MRGGYLGPEFSDDQIEKELFECGANFKKLTKKNNDTLQML